MNPNPVWAGKGPFDLDDEAAYARWRDAKRESAPKSAENLIVEMVAPAAPTPAERDAVRAVVGRANMCVYAGPAAPALESDGVRALGRAFGLERLDANMLSGEDGISALTVADQGTKAKYIPYTDRPISWHTDGYYNPLDQQVRAIILHCVEPAGQGGENALMDHEMAYIELRERDPGHIAALMRGDAMTIPGNAEAGFDARPDSPGPVFMVMPDGRLHMRFTDRKRNIVWADDPAVAAAVEALRDILNESDGCVLRHSLEAGQGLLCNNVLHNRTGFSDDGSGKRFIYRARYHDRIAGT